MAWLETVMGGINNAMGMFQSETGGQGNTIAQLLSLFGANQAINKYNVATPSEDSSMAIYRAMLDPNSPMMKNMTGQSREQGIADFQSQLREMQLADRRATSMGRAPTFFSPERADQTVSYLTSRGLPKINEMATQNALQRMTTAAGGMNNFAPAQQARQTIDANNMANNYSIPEQLLKMFTQGGFQQTPMR